jgi:hypothetical protein
VLREPFGQGDYASTMTSAAEGVVHAASRFTVGVSAQVRRASFVQSCELVDDLLVVKNLRPHPSAVSKASKKEGSDYISPSSGAGFQSLSQHENSKDCDYDNRAFQQDRATEYNDAFIKLPEEFRFFGGLEQYLGLLLLKARQYHFAQISIVFFFFVFTVEAVSATCGLPPTPAKAMSKKGKGSKDLGIVAGSSLSYAARSSYWTLRFGGTAIM